MTKKEESELAATFGAAMIPDHHRGHGWSMFELNGWTIWFASSGWIRAKLVDDRYTDHRTHKSLREALSAASLFKAS